MLIYIALLVPHDVVLLDDCGDDASAPETRKEKSRLEYNVFLNSRPHMLYTYMKIHMSLVPNDVVLLNDCGDDPRRREGARDAEVV